VSELRIVKGKQTVGDVEVTTSILVPVPEHERLQRISADSQTIGAFLDWLMHEREPRTDLYERKFIAWTPCPQSIQSLLAEYFKIDQSKLEAEKVAMLEAIRRE
jgi:hypothetical protein